MCRVNCPFYFKIGACRHGDTCTRLHNKPSLSQTLLLPHLYSNPPAAIAFSDGIHVPEPLLIEAIAHFEDFYEEVYLELAKYGEVQEMHVCDNIGEHMLGNVYVKYYREEDADKALRGLHGRFYSGRLIKVEFSPVSDFGEARCRLFREGTCDRGGYCNFMHLKHVSKELEHEVRKIMYGENPEYKELKQQRKRVEKRKKSRSQSEEDKPKKRKQNKKQHNHHREHSSSSASSSSSS